MLSKEYISWTLRILSAFIIFQIVYFKLLGDPSCIYIFEKIIGIPMSRIYTGLLELVTGIALLIPRTKILGASMALLEAISCLIAHFTLLGIIVNNDGGVFFSMTLSVFFLSLAILLLHKGDNFCQEIKTPINTVGY